MLNNIKITNALSWKLNKMLMYRWFWYCFFFAGKTYNGAFLGVFREDLELFDPKIALKMPCTTKIIGNVPSRSPGFLFPIGLLLDLTDFLSSHGGWKQQKTLCDTMDPESLHDKYNLSIAEMVSSVLSAVLIWCPIPFRHCRENLKLPLSAFFGGSCDKSGIFIYTFLLTH